MHSPSSSDLRAARDRFRHLLASETRELDWQRFFTDHPYVLSLSLPVRLEPADILPLGRPGRAEPDFAFYPHAIRPIPYFGVIELKRPQSAIVSLARSNVAILTRDAQTAIQQAKLYVKDTHLILPPVSTERPLILGNAAYIFVIMGMSREITEKLGHSLYREMLEDSLPKNLQLLPYDTLLQRFEAQLPPRVFFLFPWDNTNARIAPPSETEIVGRFKEMLEDDRLCEYRQECQEAADLIAAVATQYPGRYDDYIRRLHRIAYGIPTYKAGLIVRAAEAVLGRID